MKHRNNDFIRRFNSLNSQENTEEIIWTCSSSDNENDGEINSILKRKHPKAKKRKVNKELLINNICNLDVTILDSQETRENIETSPILKPRLSKTISNCARINSSPVTETQKSTSPILPSRTDESRNIFVSKPKENSQIVCKKLFKENITNHCKLKKCSVSPVSYKRSSEHPSLIKNKCEEAQNSENHIPKKTELVTRIKSYFQRSLSTDSLSQNSISEYSTPKNSSKTSDEIEITDFTQSSPAQRTHGGSPINTNIVKSKQIKYKKDGLAFRLDNLLKKQNANISLWQHEHYLANNSNFILPKPACTTFLIQKINYKFGCYLILAMNEKAESFVVLINNLFANGKLIESGILKVYEPYNVLDLNNNCKLIVNVCKYVCESFN